MRRRQLHGDNYSGIRAESHGGEIFVSQVKGNSLLEVSGDLVQRATLGDDGDFYALRHESGLLAGPNHGFDGLLKHHCPGRGPV
jgi:hypothetical protein